MEQREKNVIPPLSTFYGAPACPNFDELSADVAFLGVPFDQGGYLRSPAGQKWGPKAFRDLRKAYNYSGPEYSSNAGGEKAGGWFDINTNEWKLSGVSMVDCGDVNILPTQGEKNCDTITEVVKRIVARDTLLVSIGGDHTITFPVVRAFGRHNPLDIVHLDAHLDFGDSMEGVKIYNASCIRRCSELPFVRNITQIGFRGHTVNSVTKGSHDAAMKYGCNIITAKQFRQMGISQVIERIPQAENLYVTLDVDVFDPSIVPATPAHAPGGFSYWEVEETLAGVAKKGKVVGCDIVCLIPDRDPSGIASRVAVDIIIDFLSAVFPSKK